METLRSAFNVNRARPNHCRMSALSKFASWTWQIIGRNKLVSFFLLIHLLFAAFLGRLFALAPDEGGYLYTFNHLYGGHVANPQFDSGWIAAPKLFLWVTYLPAKVLNILGVPDFLSIRILSILLAAFSIVLLKNLQRRSSDSSSRFDYLIFIFFFIPSIFLWTSVGLRETFILTGISLFLAGWNHLFEGRTKRGIAYLTFGSYGLLSTKNYLWVCLELSLFLVIVFLTIRHVPKRRIVNLLLGAVLIPCLLFASTTSVYALEFLFKSIFQSDISSAAARSGDSVVQVALPNSSGGSGGKPSSGSTGSSGSSGSSKGSTVVTFHGDSTLILLHFYLVDHPRAIFTRVFGAIGIKAKVQDIWNAKVKAGLVKKTAAALPDSSSLSGYILKPGSLHNPVSVLRPAFLFMFGPIPFLDQGGVALDAVTFESPMWWILYGLVFYRMIRYRRSGYFRDPLFLFAGTYFLSLVAISALVEVNLGTSFRHRSILLIPLIVMYIRARGKTPAIAD